MVSNELFDGERFLRFEDIYAVIFSNFVRSAIFVPNCESFCPRMNKKVDK